VVIPSGARSIALGLTAAMVALSTTGRWDRAASAPDDAVRVVVRTPAPSGSPLIDSLPDWSKARPLLVRYRALAAAAAAAAHAFQRYGRTGTGEDFGRFLLAMAGYRRARDRALVNRAIIEPTLRIDCD
jgi:hypothetical protein